MQRLALGICLARQPRRRWPVPGSRWRPPRSRPVIPCRQGHTRRRRPCRLGRDVSHGDREQRTARRSTMDSPDVYPDALGDALSHSSQRLAQLGSLITAAATMQIRRRAQGNAANAARSQRELRVLQERQRAAWQLVRARWAPAHDSRWLAQADLLQAARVWGAATAYADADQAATSAARKCEERLRVLHPYAMARYDRLRSEGAGAFEAMRQAVPLFGRAPHARPGDPAAG